MIPSKLKLLNFTSYTKPPELDFSKFKLGAISGHNGAGKSSLLDAITWCLWGTSRAGDSSDPLIHSGEEVMEVEFEFMLDSHSFVVKRHRSKKGGGSTSLELWSGSHNLTEGTIKATQQKIIDTLHLSFETFTNSAFLRQGHADEFTTKGPTDRKRILADILGLDHYDVLEEKAKEKAKEAQTKLSLLEYQVLEIEAELSQKQEREKNLSQIQKMGEETQKHLKEAEVAYKEIENECKILETNINSLKEQKERFFTLKKELLDLKDQIELKQQAIKQYQQILDRKKEIEENNTNLSLLQESRKALEGKRSELIKAKDELVSVERQLLEREDKRKEAINKLALEIKELQTTNSQNFLQIDSLKKQKDICPTCGQIINNEKHKSIIKSNEKIISENEEKIKSLEETVKKYAGVVLPEGKKTKEKELEVKKLEDATKDWLQIQEKIQELEHYSTLFLKLKEAQGGVKAHTEAIVDLEKISKSKELELSKSEELEISLNSFAQKLLETESRLSAQANVKEELNQKLLDLRGQYGEAKQLVSRTEQLENLSKQKLEEKSKLTKEKEIYEELSLAFGKKGIQAMIIEQAIPEIEDETNSLLERLTEGRMKIRLDTQRETKTKVATMDGGKEHSIVETLDIIISDEMGERPYEMYSGGEAFRVNFAIRLAISKLLTHRAGARLQFLVIDEGFGTQDMEGRSRLVEVIDAIKNDFEKIVIITHLEELKEEFPTRIEVSKTSSGSTFEVVGS